MSDFVAGDRARPITESGNGNPGTVLAVHHNEWEQMVWFLPDQRPGWAWQQDPYTVRAVHLQGEQHEQL